MSLDEPAQVPATKEIWLSERVPWVPTMVKHCSQNSSGPRNNVTSNRLLKNH